MVNNLYNYQFNLKNFKLNNIIKIINNNKYILICRYSDLKSLEIIDLKILLKNNKIGFYSIKQNSFKKKKLKQGPIYLFYFNELNKLNIIFNISNIQILYLLKNKFLKFSNLKLNKLIKFIPNQQLNFLFNLKSKLISIVFILKQIS